MDKDIYFMKLALQEAERAFSEGEVPIGAVIVKDGVVVGRGHNQVERLKDPTAHAEIIAITSAASTLNNWRLKGCTIYVTVEPCPMCAGALILSRIDRVVYGVDDKKFGALGSVCDIAKYRFNHKFDVEKGVLAREAEELLKAFFSQIRKEMEGWPSG
ncbi:tRNA adenosine(34) deaminase TadA [candidate division WOR-3 bacterium]|nr:tRNA adenosine(34) deaminase TadA [candidate division WOR-3 bacterium]